MSPETPKKPKNQEDTGHAIDQSEIDALLAGGGDSTLDQGSEPSKAEGPTPNQDASRTIDQDELDALVAQMTSSGAIGAPLDGVGPPDAAEDEEELSETLDQDELDSLIAGMAGAASGDEDEALDDTLDQAELDALLAGLSGGEGKGGAIGEKDLSETLDQADLDALIAGMATKESPAAPVEEPVVEEELSETLDQADLDALIAGMAGEEGVVESSPSEPTVEEEAVPVDTAPEPDEGSQEVLSLTAEELDQLLSGEDADRPLDNKDLDVVLSESAAGRESGMDAPLKEDEDEKAVLDQADIDAVIAQSRAAAQAEKPVVAQPAEKPAAKEGLSGKLDQAELDALLSGMSAKQAPPAPSEKPAEDVLPLTEAEATETVGTENLAAAAHVQGGGLLTQDALDELLKDAAAKGVKPKQARVREEKPKETASTIEVVEMEPESGAEAEVEAEPVAAPVIEEEAEPKAKVEPTAEPAPAPKAKPARKAKPKREWRLTIPVPKIPAKLAGKAGLSLAAGLACAVSTYWLLGNVGAKVPEFETLTAQRDTGLGDVIERGRALLDTGDYDRAARLLDNAISKAPADPLRDDAEFLLVEASYKALPERPSSYEVEMVNSRIDTFLGRARSHPRALDVLGWKADLYERADIPFSALRVYDDILTSFADVPRKDKVLFEAARLALKVGRASEASDYARRLLEQFPASPFGGQAKLLLGEALVAGGQEEEGRKLLLQVAESQPHSRIGADAYTRLGQLAYDAGKYDEAIAQLTGRLESATTFEGNDQILLQLAKSYRATNQLEPAQSALRDLIEFFPDSEVAPQAYVALSEVLDQLGRRDEALRVAAQAAQRFPKRPEVLIHHAKLRELTGDTYGAAQSLMAADEAGANDPAILLTAGGQFLKAEYLDDARDAFELLARKFPNTPQEMAANIELAKITYEKGNTREAIRQLENLAMLTQDTPQQIPILLSLADIYYGLGFNKRASEVYRNVAAETTEPETLAKAATALLRANEMSDGLDVANRVDVTKLSDRTAYDFLMTRGQALLLSDSARAIQEMEQAYNSYPDIRTPNDAQRLLEAYMATDRVAQARVFMTELESHTTPVDAENLRKAAITWGDALYNKGDFRTAASAYEMAANADSRQTLDAQWAKYKQASALLQMNDTQASLPLLEEVAGSSSPWAQDAQVKLDYIRLQQRLNGEAQPAPQAQG